MAKDKGEFKIKIKSSSAKRMGKSKFLELHKGLASVEELSKEFDKVVPPLKSDKPEKK